MQAVKDFFSKTPTGSPSKTTIPNIAQPTDDVPGTPTGSPPKRALGGPFRTIEGGTLSKPPTSSRSCWDADDEEFNPNIYNDLSPSKTIRGSPFRSARGTSPLKGRNPVNDLSCWDADDDEWDDSVYTDLKKNVETYKSTYGSFKHSGDRKRYRLNPAFNLGQDSYRSSAGSFDTVRSAAYENDTIRGETRIINPEEEEAALKAEEELRDQVEELADANCSNPIGPDLHDEVMQNMFTTGYEELPPFYPARHMHILDLTAFQQAEQPLLAHAHPRLCDAVATVLHEANSESLTDFLNPKATTFEWRRDMGVSGTRWATKLSVVIRRVGNEVLVGTYRPHGFHYTWTHYVRSTISFTGKWTETYAGIDKGLSRVTGDGPQWDVFELRDPHARGVEDLDPEDPKFALFVGRKLARYLLEEGVWEGSAWEVDGKKQEGQGGGGESGRGRRA
ncbi:hypothetical protein BDV95DRAFT_606619 [Massariosphaeria phaeospora]|uniref:Uncharacterized protein n=1 Tax=Massariosphaeria phaeospora TaxID=100035 RepID=A0A7C8M8M7_9PLEO|nr:hypothetical protein BDV95DRAFT_606619 [Massariosphaeria phaeospora]